MASLPLAIKEASATKLRAIITQACNSNAETKKLFESLLLVNDPDASSDTDGALTKSNTAKKRKVDDISGKKLVPRFLTCFQCGEEYDVSKNTDKSCIWHEGEKEVANEEGFWDRFDWEDWRDGAYEDHIDDPEFEEGFEWNCCKKSGDSEGCMVTKHKHDVD